MTTDAVGGVWTHALDLCRGLGATGWKVTLVGFGPAASPAQRAEVEGIGAVRYVETGLALEWMPQPWRDVDRAGGLLLRLAAEERPDVIHLNGYAHAALGWTAPVLVGAHSCVATWWRAVHGAPPPAEWGEYTRRVRAGLAAATTVVAPSTAFLAALRAAYGWNGSGQAIPNGTDAPARSWSADVREPVVLAAGRLWDDAKGLTTLAAIAPGLRWRVEVAGDRGLTEVAPAALHFLGKLPRPGLRARMGEVAIFAAPARYEPFGLAILEAAQAGCALALSDLPSLREHWDGAARFVPATDPAAWRATLEELAADEAQREWLSQRAAERARAFPTSRMVAGYLDAYAALLGAPPRTAATEGAAA